VQCRN
jgi:hypothetical protein